MFKLNLVEKLVISFHFGGNRRYELARNQGNTTTHISSDIVKSSVDSQAQPGASRNVENILSERD